VSESVETYPVLRRGATPFHSVLARGRMRAGLAMLGPAFVALSDGCADPTAPKALRASAGAIEHLPVAVVPNLARYLAEVKSGELWIYAAAGDAETSMWDTDLSGGIAFVFGAEGKGLRPLVRRTCDAAVSIPLAGKVESLNVSVAAAVLLYEAARQRRQRS